MCFTRLIPLLVLSLCLLLSLQCNNCSTRSEQESTSPALTHTDLPVPAPTAQPPKDAPATINEAAFTLETKPDASYHARTDAALSLRLKAHAPWHINEEYPFNIKVEAPTGVRFAKTTFAKTEAKHRDESELLFALPFQADPGDHKVTLVISFAVCTPENCMPDDRTLSAQLHVL